jgi:predicted dehydrogenase
MSLNKVNWPVRVLLIGAGGISSVHIRGMRKHPDRLRCVGMVDISEENLGKRAEELGERVTTFTDWKKALADLSGKVDAAVICLPHHLHAPAIHDCARAGLHILCEKPLCLTLEEAEGIAQVVAETGVTYMSAHNQLFLPAVREARKMLDQGALGRVFYIRSQDCFQAHTDRARWGWRADSKTQGGGVLIDTGYHPTYRLIHLANSRPVAVRGTMGRYRLPIDGEDTAAVQVRFENGILGEVFASWAIPLPAGTHQIHVVGESGQIFGSESTLFHLPSGAKEPARIPLEEVDYFAEQIAHFAMCLRDGIRPPHGVEEGTTVLRIILEAADSAAGWNS